MIKLILSIVILTFSLSLVGQEVNEEENPVTFHIRLGAWVKIPQELKVLIKKNEMVVISKMNVGTEVKIIHTAQGYKCYAEATEMNREFVDRGYQDSFIIAFDRGLRIKLAEAIIKTKPICK